jgi:BirA family transcriptional regulator, biotin operon repressor / biotin---[acetyl-CoA-carboxylase] ligase
VLSNLQNNIFSQLFVGQNIVSLASVDSTNSWLKELLSKSEPVAEGTVIMAEEQFAGRGQMSNTWVSESGKNLTISILLKPDFLPVDQQFLLNQTVSLALNDVLRKFFDNTATIKWPNDCYVGPRKIGGVLIENIIQGGQIKNSVIGIGLNVNQVEYPESLKNVTSFKKILHRDYDLRGLLSEICAAIEVRYLQLRGGHTSGINNEYLERLYKRGIYSMYRIGEETVKGRILGTSRYGQLEVEIEGETRQFGLKEIEFIQDMTELH